LAGFKAVYLVQSVHALRGHHDWPDKQSDERASTADGRWKQPLSPEIETDAKSYSFWHRPAIAGNSFNSASHGSAFVSGFWHKQAVRSLMNGLAKVRSHK